MCFYYFFFFFKQKTAYEVRISDWSSDVCSSDLLVSLGCFSLIEGAVLYSSFAFLKHFQTRGKNKLLNVVRGINFSVRDENLHCVAGSWLIRSLRDERLKEIPTYRHDLENVIQSVVEADRKSTRLNSSHTCATSMQSYA